MFLLDTDILSALRKRQRNPRLMSWISAQRDADLFLSAITIAEIERGIFQASRTDPKFSEELARWLDRVLEHYGDRILPFDCHAARRFGALSARIGNDSPDLMIAAIALDRGLTVATHNLRHFVPTGVTTVDPLV
jgi:predicted nucleic acid-binding protein